MFRTFQGIKKTNFTLGKILFFFIILDVLAIAGLLILALFPQFYRQKDTFLETTFTLNMVLIALFLLSALNYILFKGKKKASLAGMLEIRENEIVVNDQTLRLDELERMRFIGNDVKGDFRGHVSKGIGNEFIAKLKSGEQISVTFEQTRDNNLMGFKNILKGYYQRGLLSESNYQNIINNTNYY